VRQIGWDRCETPRQVRSSAVSGDDTADEDLHLLASLAAAAVGSQIRCHRPISDVIAMSLMTRK
jgi:hypothetical protein